MLHEYRQLYTLHKTKDIYVDIAKEVKERFDTSNYDLGIPLLKGKNKNYLD